MDGDLKAAILQVRAPEKRRYMRQPSVQMADRLKKEKEAMPVLFIFYISHYHLISFFFFA